FHAAFQGVHTTFNLGDHSRPNHPFLDHLAGLIHSQCAEQFTPFVFHSVHVRHENEFLGVQRLGPFPPYQLPVDIIGLALISEAQWGDDWNELIFIERIDHQRVDTDDHAHHADIDDLRRLAIGRNGDVHFARENEAAILAAQTHCHPPVLIYQSNDLFVDLPHKNHLDDV